MPNFVRLLAIAGICLFFVLLWKVSEGTIVVKGSDIPTYALGGLLGIFGLILLAGILDWVVGGNRRHY